MKIIRPCHSPLEPTLPCPTRPETIIFTNYKFSNLIKNIYKLFIFAYIEININLFTFILYCIYDEYYETERIIIIIIPILYNKYSFKVFVKK